MTRGLIVVDANTPESKITTEDDQHDKKVIRIRDDKRINCLI